MAKRPVFYCESGHRRWNVERCCPFCEDIERGRIDALPVFAGPLPDVMTVREGATGRVTTYRSR